MKLFVIVLCLLSERFLIHAIALKRFEWFSNYFFSVSKCFPQSVSSLNTLIILSAVLLPILILSWIILAIFDHFLFGIIYFIVNLLIFYYCLGPENSFYPVREETDEEHIEVEVGRYFAKVNGQLFAVIFWYILTGPLGIILYRLLSLCKQQALTGKVAIYLTNLLDWIPARITVILYLLVGNFQRGFHFFMQKFISAPASNDFLLSNAGLLAARTNENETIQMPTAEHLVEHALIVYLVFLALFTLGAWL